MTPISPFASKVIQLILEIPKGKVATYKQIAELAEKPQGSRAVSWILHSCSTIYKLPWHRVINSQGKISFEKNSHNYRQQKARLKKEGVNFDKTEKINLSQFQWQKKVRKPKAGPRMFG